MTQTLIPVCSYTSGFTTCDELKDKRLTSVDLDDKALGISKVSSGTTHKVVKPPAPLPSYPSGIPPPKEAWEAVYPKGSINPGAEIPGGFGFYLAGPSAFSKQLQAGATEVLMSYRMMLQKDWEWVKGGKLPGWFGGIGNSAYGCTGGRQDLRCQCFDMRAMWRADGLGELYTYLPLVDQNKTSLSKVPPKFVANSDFGFSVGRGAYNWEKAVGNWVSVACRIKLNDVGQSDGEVEMWIDGSPVIAASGLIFRGSKDSVIKGMHFQTFFGGHTEDWASPKDQKAWFADITGVIINDGK